MFDKAFTKMHVFSRFFYPRYESFTQNLQLQFIHTAVVCTGVGRTGNLFEVVVFIDHIIVHNLLSSL